MSSTKWELISALILKISSHVSSNAGTKDALGTKVDVRWRCRSDSHSGWLRQYLVWRRPVSISIEWRERALKSATACSEEPIMRPAVLLLRLPAAYRFLVDRCGGFLIDLCHSESWKRQHALSCSTSGESCHPHLQKQSTFPQHFTANRFALFKQLQKIVMCEIQSSFWTTLNGLDM